MFPVSLSGGLLTKQAAGYNNTSMRTKEKIDDGFNKDWEDSNRLPRYARN